MMNNVENKNDLNKMSDLEFGKNKVEMMRYRDNSLSYKLGMGGIVFSVLACFVCLNSFNPTSFTTILAILLNIVVLLGGFLCIEKSKAYSFNGSVALIVFGGICVARIFWIPYQLIDHYNGWIADGKSQNSSHIDYIGKTITTNPEKNNISYLPMDGIFRGVLAIVFLVIAASFFIAAGYIGVVRSRKLSTYLNSLNQKKVGGN